MSPPPAAGPGMPGQGSTAGRRIRAVLLLVVLAEVVLAIQVGRWVGAPAAIMLLILLSGLGVWVLRRVGRRAMSRFDPARAGFPGSGTAGAGTAGAGTGRPGPPGPPTADDLAETATLAAGGLLLVLPGLLTGAAGLLLVFPPTRTVLRPLLGRLTLPATVRLMRAAGVARIVEGETVEGEVVGVEVLDVRDVPGREPGAERGPGGEPPELPPWRDGG